MPAPLINVNTRRTTYPRISGAEWEVMKVVWAHAPCSSREVTDILNGTGHAWHPITVRTFLGRLVRKAVLRFGRHGRGYLYRSLLGEPQCLDAECGLFLRRYFDGSIGLMLAHFIARKKLSVREIRELKELLEACEADHLVEPASRRGPTPGGLRLRTSHPGATLRPFGSQPVATPKPP
jgi:BlaI family penicillinase repressor